MPKTTPPVPAAPAFTAVPFPPEMAAELAGLRAQVESLQIAHNNQIRGFLRGLGKSPQGWRLAEDGKSVLVQGEPGD